MDEDSSSGDGEKGSHSRYCSEGRATESVHVLNVRGERGREQEGEEEEERVWNQGFFSRSLVRARTRMELLFAKDWRGSRRGF